MLDVDAEPAEAPAPHAWLVRGSSVDGRDLVLMTWLQQGLVSLAAANLRPLQPPVSLDVLRDGPTCGAQSTG